jgi:ribokinase
VQLIGRLGNDVFGDQLRSHLGSAGVDTTAVASSNTTSGVAVIVVSQKGENSIVVTPGANAEVTPEDLDRHIHIIRGAGIVLAQLEIPVETIEYLAVLCEREGVQLILDPAPAMELPADTLKRVAWFTPNESEAAFYLEGRAGIKPAAPQEIANELLSRGIRGVVLKMGESGIFLAREREGGKRISAFSVQAVDTTAAGDAFNGGFATGLMLGKSPEDSAVFAAAVAGISVTRQGAQPSMPSRSEVDAFLENASMR